MGKLHSRYVCQQCGYELTGWMGKCPNCGTWGSLVEEITDAPTGNTSKSVAIGKPIQLSTVSSQKLPRVSTKIKEFDRALGGGIVTGQVILIAGIPGIGKSTLLLQLANNLGNVLYVSGEESVNQIGIRAQRLGIKNEKVNILEETDIDTVIATAQKIKPELLIVDSIQTMTTSDLSGVSGSVGQVRECAFRLVRFSKRENIPVFIVGHVTKEGTVGGPSVLAHIVDTVLWFEGDKSLTLRMIRSMKNRFGPTDEVGVFEMEEKGLISISNPEKVFLSTGTKSVAGSVVSAIIQGTRPVFVEIETLVVSSKLAFPKRVAQGVDAKRFELLIAVLTRRCNIPLYESDCFVNVAGGIVARTPYVDLAICLSLASSYYDKAMPKDVFVIGEVGLLGEIRKVVGQEKITKEAKQLGYKKVISSTEFKSLQQVIKSLF